MLVGEDEPIQFYPVVDKKYNIKVDESTADYWFSVDKESGEIKLTADKLKATEFWVNIKTIVVDEISGPDNEAISMAFVTSTGAVITKDFRGNLVAPGHHFCKWQPEPLECQHNCSWYHAFYKVFGLLVPTNWHSYPTSSQSNADAFREWIKMRGDIHSAVNPTTNIQNFFSINFDTIWNGVPADKALRVTALGTTLEELGIGSGQAQSIFDAWSEHQ